MMTSLLPKLANRAYGKVIPQRALLSTSTKSVKLSDQERINKLSELASSGTPFSWKESSEDNKDAIAKTFQFTDFSQAWSFMSRVALLAEKMDHHPEWFNVYNTVQVKLTTHDCSGISEKDIKMAKAMDEYAGALLSSSKK